jgi:hypothetical protein
MRKGSCAATVCLAVLWPCSVQSSQIPREILAFYYGWYGTPAVSGVWRHWTDVDPIHREIANSADFPVSGAYDSHDPSAVAQQVGMAKGAGITGFIVSWWGRIASKIRVCSFSWSRLSGMGSRCRHITRRSRAQMTPAESGLLLRIWSTC